MTIKRKIAFGLSKGGELQWVPIEKKSGGRRRPQLCRKKTVEEIKALARKFRISLTKRVEVAKTKADLCASIARRVKVDSTPIGKQLKKSTKKAAPKPKKSTKKAAPKPKKSTKKAAPKPKKSTKMSLRKYGYSLKSENNVRKPALNAAVKNSSRDKVAKRLTFLGRVQSKKNPVYSQRAFKNAGYVKKETKKAASNNISKLTNQELKALKQMFNNNNNNNNFYVRRSNSNSNSNNSNSNKTNISELNNALNRIKKGGRLSANELANLGNKLTNVQKKRWNRVVTNFNTGSADPLSNEEFRRLRSRYSKK
jgi:hypothetical protein